MGKRISVHVYYALIDGKKVIDEDSMREEFEQKLKEIVGD